MVKPMDEAVKNFTMVDYLGILLPGLTLLYAAKPIRDIVTTELLTEHTVLAIAGIAFAGYILGHAVEQVGAMLEDILWQSSFWQKAVVPKNYFDDPSVQEAYRYTFAADSVPEAWKDQCTATGEIFRYVQQEQRTERIIILDSEKL